MKTKTTIMVFLLMVILSVQVVVQGSSRGFEFTDGASAPTIFLVIISILSTSVIILPLMFHYTAKKKALKYNAKDREVEADMQCTNCGRVIPLDERTCPYCSKKPEDY